MRRKYLTLLTFLTLLLCSLPVSPQLAVASREEVASLKWDFAAIDKMRDIAYVDEDSVEVIVGEVQFTHRPKLVELVERYGGKVVSQVLNRGVEEAIVVDLPLTSAASFVEATGAANIAEYIEPNFKFEIQFTPNDPYFMEQWGLTKIEAPWAWNLDQGRSSVLVAVVDTGISWNHPDLAPNYVPLGYDWVYNDANPMDDNGHGTHVAGIVAAELNNEIGVAGVAQVSVMAEKGLNTWGEGYVDDLAKAINHAVEQGADIISMSWGDYEDSWLLHRALIDAYRAGVLLVAAAGNDATSERMYPAAYDEVIAVSATNENDYPAWFTNYGDWVELSAPGVRILSTLWDDDYGIKSGTSMATPYVSGVAALVWGLYPEKTRDELRTWLRDKSDDLGEPGFDHVYGYGRINAKKAVSTPNIAVTGVSLGKSVVGQGFTVEVKTSVANFNLDTQTLNLSAYLNETVLQTMEITLEGTNSTTLSITWNTGDYVKGRYAVRAYVLPVPGETETDDNSLIGGWVLVTIAGDVNGDFGVNIFDITMIACSYGSHEGGLAYNPDCDINSDRRIDLLDIVIAAGNYGRAEL
ncbi:MAG TPA: S8 family serine peptidase [Candidatus Paceibacterota bacterium]|nr:S8 family serine peptidase [Candidatus Paceibacterota bacterium]